MSARGDEGLYGAPPDPWDPVVRLTHWAVAAMVIGNRLVTEGGSLAHVWLGWLGMGFLLLRLVWGFVGPAPARFTSFPLRPRAALAHLLDLARGRPREYRSHNPAGAAMAYALWGTLAAIIVSGLLLTSGATPFEIARQKAAVNEGDWSALVSQDSDDEDSGEGGKADREILEEVHEIAANLLLILAVLHLGGVAVESIALKRNLVRPMVRSGKG
jgi:cytochrome b